MKYSLSLFPFKRDTNFAQQKNLFEIIRVKLKILNNMFTFHNFSTKTHLLLFSYSIAKVKNLICIKEKGLK